MGREQKSYSELSQRCFQSEFSQNIIVFKNVRKQLYFHCYLIRPEWNSEHQNFRTVVQDINLTVRPIKHAHETGGIV